MQKITYLYSQIKDKLDIAEEEVMLINIKVSCLCKQCYLWAKKMAYVVHCGIKTINKLDQLEVEEAKAKYKRITK